MCLQCYWFVSTFNNLMSALLGHIRKKLQGLFNQIRHSDMLSNAGI